MKRLIVGCAILGLLVGMAGGAFAAAPVAKGKTAKPAMAAEKAAQANPVKKVTKPTK